LATDKNYKRKEFLKKLVKMMVNLKDIRQKKPNLVAIFKGVKKGGLYEIPLDSSENGFHKMLFDAASGEHVTADLVTLSLFARSNKAPAVFKGFRKKDGEPFAVFSTIGPDKNSMKDKLISLDDFTFYKKSGIIHKLDKTNSNYKAFYLLKGLMGGK